jgi:phage baseplate assembly protein W
MKKQFYGIKFPFTNNDVENYYVDLNSKPSDKVKSILMHVVFTPKGQKIRDPEFGTDLIKYIFQPNDSISWDGIKSEVSNIVSKYVNGVTLKNIEIMQNENDLGEIYVRLDYSVSNFQSTINDSLIVKI